MIGNELIGEFVERSRQRLIDNQGEFIDYMHKSAGRQSLQTFLKSGSHVEDAVRHVASEMRIDDPGLIEEAEDSIKFRVLAGVLTQPLEYDDDTTPVGTCKNQKFMPEKGCWDCKVSDGNQAQANAWHQKHGYSPGCPFYVPTTNPKEHDTEMDKMLDEGMTLEEAHRILSERTNRYKRNTGL